MRPPSTRLRGDDRGVASGVITFLVAGVVFVAAVGAVLFTSHTAGTGQAASAVQPASLNFQAKNLAQLLLGSPGINATGGDWYTTAGSAGATPGANGMKRLGLAESGDTSVISFNKVQNLRMAPLAASGTDGYVNYPEARAGLGLGAAKLDFHIRAYPSLKTVADILATGVKDPNLRVTYLGDILVSKTQGQPPPSNPTDGLVVGAPTCAVSPATAAPNPQNYRISTLVTNGGTTTTQFTVLYSFLQTGTAPAGHQDPSSRSKNSFLIAPGASATIYVDVPATSSFGGCDANEKITADAHDPSVTHLATSQTLATAVTGAATAPTDLLLDTSKPSFVNANGATSNCADPIQFSYDGPAKNDWVYLEIKDSGGAVKFSEAQKVPAASSQHSFPSSGSICLVAGEYTATLYYCGGSSCTGGATKEQVNENVLVTTAAVAAYNPPSQPPPNGPDQYTATASSSTEVKFLDSLIERFCPTYYNSKTETAMDSAVTWSSRCAAFASSTTGTPDIRPGQPGDVFPGSKDILNNELPKRLVDDPSKCNNDSAVPRYDVVNVLVAGSNLDQTAMTSSAAKKCIAAWVLGGGTLLVFGSADQNVNWLEPIFHAAIRSSSGGLAVPDPGHPVLHSADELDYPHYVNNNRVWNFNGQTALNAAQLFTNVVTQGSDPITTVSNPGAMGEGSVGLTTWQPSSVYGSGGDPASGQAEGLKLVNNLLMQGYRDLFLDYGPRLPVNTNVIPAVDFVSIKHPQFVDPIALRVDVYVFPG